LRRGKTQILKSQGEKKENDGICWNCKEFSVIISSLKEFTETLLALENHLGNSEPFQVHNPRRMGD